MDSLTLLSPAKVNLYLKVINKRSDGFHNIETLFERISLFDDIRFKSNDSSSIRVVCDHRDVPSGRKNLVYQVAEALQNDFGIKAGVDIAITKRIPVAAGLGGGSSNAATTLLGLNKIWELNLSREQLVSYGRRLGSDVAFFLHDCPWALGTERGDQIQSLDIKTELWHVLVVPCIKMYSRKVYASLRLEPAPSDMNMLTKKESNVSILLRNLQENNISETGRLLSNDLETAIVRLCPRLLTLKEKMKSLGSPGVIISGSGPCVFSLVSAEKEAKEMHSILAKRFSRVFMARTF